MPVRRFAAACLTLITVAACSRSTPELTSPPPSAKASETAEAMGAKAPAATEPTGGGGGGHSETPAVPTPLLTPGATDETPSGTPGADPLNGTFTLADAAKDLKGSGPLVATLDTTSGALTCTLYEDKAPNTVANFIGLARGTRPWKDASGTWVKRPAYNATSFHRVIKGFMIQGGDFRGNGTGEPGYVIKDEIWEGAKHDRAGLLCMANRGPDTNGAQFFITDAVTPHLDGGYTIFGECAPEATVHAIAGVPVNGSSPKTPVLIKKVTIARSPQSGK